MSEDYSEARRFFLKSVVLAAGAAVAAPTATNAMLKAKPVVQVEPPSAKGYKETVHISKYYQTARS